MEAFREIRERTQKYVTVSKRTRITGKEAKPEQSTANRKSTAHGPERRATVNDQSIVREVVNFCFDSHLRRNRQPPEPVPEQTTPRLLFADR